MSLEDILSQGISGFTDIEVAKAESRPSNPVPNVRGAAGASTLQGQNALYGVGSAAGQVPVWGWIAGGIVVTVIIIAVVKR